MKKRTVLFMAVVGVLLFAQLAGADGGMKSDEKMGDAPEVTESEILKEEGTSVTGGEVALKWSEMQEKQEVGGLIGKTVTNMIGQSLGKITDVFIDNKTDEIVYLIVKKPAFLGFGGEERVVPFQAIYVNDTDGRIQLSMDLERYNSAPTRQPNMSDREWGREVHEFYGVSPYWEEIWTPPSSYEQEYLPMGD